MKNKYNLSVSEKEIMDLLWEHGEMSSKEILHYFNTEKNKDWKNIKYIYCKITKKRSVKEKIRRAKIHVYASFSYTRI